MAPGLRRAAVHLVFRGGVVAAVPPVGFPLIGSTHINFPESADEDGIREPIVFLSFTQLGKDRVVPAFAGQLTDVRVFAEPGRE